ncbi:MAG: putative DNA-binding domain-containing protein [Aquabacterium sp.]
MNGPSRLAERQSAVLDLILHDSQDVTALAPLAQTAGLRMDTAGCQAYRRNARAHAARALKQAYPTLVAMLGPTAMDTLAVRLWQQQAPSGGDLGDWGEGLPDLMARTAALAAWPWLPDSGRLDWACHVCERAEDAEPEPDSLRLLDKVPAEALHLALMPGVQWLRSEWPVAALKDAHAHDDEAVRAAAAARALETAAGGAVLVWRQDGQARWQNLPDAWAPWMQDLLSSMHAPTKPLAAPHSPTSLADHLDRAPPDFDFTAWLMAALTYGWFRRMQALPST